MTVRTSDSGDLETVALLQATLDATHDGILVVDRIDGRPQIVLYNRRYLEMFRFEASDIETKGIDWVSETLAAQIDNPDALLRRGGISRIDPWSEHGHDILWFKDGRVFERYSAPRTAGGNSIVGRVLSYRDITGTVLAQKSLEQHRAFLEQAQAVAHIGSWVFELDGSNRLSWSEETLRILGATPEQLSALDDSFGLMVHEDDKEIVRDGFTRAITTGEPYDIEHRIVRPCGAMRWVHTRANIVRDEHGTPIRAIGTVQDITDRRQLEQQLRQSQKLEAIGRLAGGVAHDLNNALTAIAGYAELALNTLPDEHPAHPDVEEIRNATQRAEAVTRQLLAFSRRQVIEPRVFSLGTTVLNLRRFLERLLGTSVHVEVSVPDDLPPIYGDPGQIEQAILNLAVNARDAMPSGGRMTIDVGLREIDESTARTHQPMKPGAYIEVSVSDTGHGMTPEVQARIFEPFFTTKEVGKGTGLGLPMVYGTVKQSAGFIFVESAPEEGTTFRIYFPPAPRAQRPEETVTIPEPALQDATILVVEDERAVRNLVVASLTKAGLRVLEASSANDAMTLFSAADPPVDLVLTDAMMPGVSGIELTRRLVHDQPTLPVIIMSGYTEESLGLGDLHHRVSLLPKPFTPGAVHAKVADVLARRR